MTRTIPPPARRSHLDFLHPARNLSRLRLGSVRLSQLERHVLGWNRSADLVWEMIPRIYLDFVRYWYADPLVPVFQEHNQMDLRGLAGLSGRILALLGEEATSQDGLELYGVSRICERCGEMKPARKLYEQSIASTLPAETDRAARRALARLAKRDGDLALARELWKSALGNSREGYEAYKQLAIYFEHEAREPRQALVIAREALTELRRANQVGMIAPPAYRRTKAKFEHRLARLERKAGQTLLDTFDTWPGTVRPWSMAAAQNQTGGHYRMDEGRKRVLAIVAGILVARHLKTPVGSGRQPPQPTNGEPGCIRSPVGRSDHEEDRWPFRQFTGRRKTMTASLEDALISVWRQALVDNARGVELESGAYTVRRTSRCTLREVDFQFEDQMLRGLEQNPNTNSRWAQLAREGKKVMQFLSDRRYVANVVDGKVQFYGRSGGQL